MIVVAVMVGQRCSLSLCVACYALVLSLVGVTIVVAWCRCYVFVRARCVVCFVVGWVCVARCCCWQLWLVRVFVVVGSCSLLHFSVYDCFCLSLLCIVGVALCVLFVLSSWL